MTLLFGLIEIQKNPNVSRFDALLFEEFILAFGLACFRSFSSYTIIGEILNTSSAKKPGN